MRKPRIPAGGTVALYAAMAAGAVIVSLLSACAPRVELTAKPSPVMAWSLEPGFGLWADNFRPLGESILSAPLPLPDMNRAQPRLLLSSLGSRTEESKPARAVVAPRTSPAKSTAFSQRGIASWYGPDFHGKLTANGEIYNQLSMTAAHKKLPFNSVVEVTDLDTGRSVTVRINNRGPYIDGRIIDLSVGAAKSLGSYEKGLANVQIKRIK